MVKVIGFNYNVFRNVVVWYVFPFGGIAGAKNNKKNKGFYEFFAERAGALFRGALGPAWAGPWERFAFQNNVT